MDEKKIELVDKMHELDIVRAELMDLQSAEEKDLVALRNKANEIRALREQIMSLNQQIWQPA